MQVNGDLMPNESKKTEDIVTIYKRVLSGENLDEMKVTDDVKTIIRDFSKYSSLTGVQISEKTGIPTRLSCSLRHVKKVHDKLEKRDCMTSSYYGVAHTARRILKGEPLRNLSLDVQPETLKNAKKCVKIIENGGGAPELYKIGIVHSEAMKLIKLYNEKSEKLEAVC